MHKLRTQQQPVADILGDRTFEVGVLVLPGLPDHATPETDQPLYPPNVEDLVKIVREAGKAIDFVDNRDRAYLDLKAAEIWLPILVFVHDALAAGVGVVVGDAIRELIGYREGRRPRLHVKLGKTQEDDRTVDWMIATGDADDVLAAIDAFLKRADD